jgi:hypothetical protein
MGLCPCLGFQWLALIFLLEIPQKKPRETTHGNHKKTFGNFFGEFLKKCKKWCESLTEAHTLNDTTNEHHHHMAPHWKRTFLLL